MEVVRVKHFAVTYHPRTLNRELCNEPEKDNGVKTVFSNNKDCILRGGLRGSITLHVPENE
jgi:hypothetical protein